MDIPRQRPVSRRRGVRRTLRYTFAFLWTLGLGVGANATMFWIVDQLLSRP